MSKHKISLAWRENQKSLLTSPVIETMCWYLKVVRESCICRTRLSWESRSREC